MSQICNTFLPVDDPTEVKRKKDSVLGAIRAQYSAFSELSLFCSQFETCYSARSIAHSRSAIRHLTTTIDNLDVALRIVANSVPSKEAMDWMKGFDFERFFAEKVQYDGMPNRPDLWQLLIEESLTGQTANSTGLLRHQLSMIRGQMQKISLTDQSRLEVTTLVRRCLSGMSEALSLSIMIGIFNDVTPLDPTWLKSSVMSVQDSGAVTERGLL